MAKKEKLTAEEKAKMLEEERCKRYNQIMAMYKIEPDKVELLGQDNKCTYLHNPDNYRLLREVVENSRITIDLKAYTDVFIMDVFYEKPKKTQIYCGTYNVHFYVHHRYGLLGSKC